MYIPLTNADPAWATFQWMPYSAVFFRESIHSFDCDGVACSRDDCERGCTAAGDRVCALNCGACTGAKGDIFSLGKLPANGLPPPAAPPTMPSFAVSQARMMDSFEGSGGMWSLYPDFTPEHMPGPHGGTMWILYRTSSLVIVDHYFIEFFLSSGVQYMQIYLDAPGLNVYNLRFVATLGRIPPN